MKRLVRRVKVKPSDSRAAGYRGNGAKLLDNSIVNRFNPSLLNLGDVSTPCQEKEAVAAVFDLTGFTRFCNQVDSYLAIPRFLNDFLDWFFSCIRNELTEKNHQHQISFWADLPVLVKFLGDGLLLVWNTRTMTEEQICRIVVSLYRICYAYQHEFYPQMSMTVNKPPATIRCGVARGKVFTIGNGSDYVGHCINTASRLSHLSPLTFCFPHRGFPVKDHMAAEYARLFIPRYLSIRGVGDNELVWVVKNEFEKLSDKQKALFRSVEQFSVLKS
jgi:class 3 adenylate cyclase